MKEIGNGTNQDRKEEMLKKLKEWILDRKSECEVNEIWTRIIDVSSLFILTKRNLICSE